MRHVSMRFQFGSKICPRLKSFLWRIGRQGARSATWIGGQPWELGIDRVARKNALMDPPLGATNIPTTNTLAMSYRCLKRMPGCEGLWLRYRTSSSEISRIEGDGHRAPKDHKGPAGKTARVKSSSLGAVGAIPLMFTQSTSLSIEYRSNDDSDRTPPGTISKSRHATWG